ncbi:PREDICTED: PR domain zinc finger protein 8 [Gekko japonicus]|uniref:PR domain zinc finger protein 8 n=1 Tax=Gekko japonicus TaxID=146911 RepID=A0ABM1L8A2_GEKJA|nr:PREDICTED: PR domain zinc finger protein 8 [Gekko japonicus]
MEESGVPRGIWEGEAKAVQQCLTDIFTSVYTTCDIPENAIFGPCVLSHTSLYDSIAFVALKSTDKRTVPYIFRVDTSAANGSSEGLMWLRLVQSARDKEEQNLEAYIKNGQLFYRSLRRIAKDEELLVWYGKELSELLLLSPARAHAKMNGSPPYACLECSQRFQFEFPYVAHLRFRCPKRLHAADSSAAEEASTKASSPKAPEGGGGPPSVAKYHAKPLHHAPHPTRHHYGGPQEGHGGATKPSTDFHNLARDMENSRERSGSPASREPSEGSPEGPPGKAKRKYPAGEALGEERVAAARGRLERPLPSSPKEDLVCTPQQQYRPAGSYFGLEESSRLFAPPSPETGEAKRSAFVEVKKASRGLDGGGSEEEKERGDGASPGSAPPDKALGGGAAAGGGLPKQSPFLYATTFWPKGVAAAAAATTAPLQLQLPSALTLLPPSFTSLCLPAQNWCAKCNASFRMTSDLVYHMRSHHKKEYALEPLVKRRREEKLKCPICNESFRERHHLSRHMTSHN